MTNNSKCSIVAILIAFSGVAYSQMYNPHSTDMFQAQRIDQPTQTDLWQAQNSAFVHGQAAAEAMSRNDDTWEIIRHQEQANQARQDYQMMQQRIWEQEQQQRIDRQNQENHWRQQNTFYDEESIEQDPFTLEPFTTGGGVRMCPLCGTEVLSNPNQRRCKKCARRLFAH